MKRRIAFYLRSVALRRGLRGDSRAWFAIWVGMTVASFLRRRLARDEVVVERFELRPGDAVEIRDTSVPWGQVKVLDR